MDCLIKQINIELPNDNLDYFGVFKIDVGVLDGVSKIGPIRVSGVDASKIFLKGATFVDSSGQDLPIQELTSSNSFYISNTGGSLYVPYNDLTRIGAVPFTSTNLPFSFNIEDLEYSEVQRVYFTAGTNEIYGDLSKAPKELCALYGGATFGGVLTYKGNRPSDSNLIRGQFIMESEDDINNFLIDSANHSFVDVGETVNITIFKGHWASMSSVTISTDARSAISSIIANGVTQVRIGGTVYTD